MVHYYLDQEFSGEQSFYCFLCEETKKINIVFNLVGIFIQFFYNI